MKRTLLVLSLGLVAGTTAHLGWFAAKRPEPVDSLDTQLAWIRTQLDLAPDQYRQLKQLHEQLGPRQLQLAAEVERLRAAFARFERERREAGEVDFLEVARAAADSRSLDRECDASARQLVSAATRVMTPEQRQRYLRLLAPALKDAGTGQPL
jgi:DNA repair exonuclease SbcCD ATPase subunit